ncbi:hypothetical protein ACRE_076570 [Hapsidospora chrysogenum ATCC 11550]|uniref:Uncharacterized protein n=1 Tax=Hapsidospora chrysogenum (strain ATCC 11550 / CBS 779.69 / DSM 880 / IAM 14645 / JCM 23072 / IMI 49137) TaxID=857340 RepID=A0A086SWY7_HAPC1|nr:hypothetical protein ACRE_076570 [Hapsidospora chrysogenum ATCC 11550]
MAMDALKNLTNNIPDWLSRLDELSGQVDQRQAELAAIAASEPKPAASETKSLRNKGSQESLKPNDDGPSNIPAPVEPQPEEEKKPEQSPEEPASTSQLAKPVTTPHDGQKPRISLSSPGPGGIASSHKPTRDAIAAANSRAKTQVKKRVKTSSMLSAEVTQTYRTRSMIIVYYDSYVQGFFDSLVRFVSSSRNLMRKAKMAAKVAEIKKMAEMEVSTADGSGDGEGVDPLPSLRYVSSRRMGALGRSGLGLRGPNDKPDVYDNLDRGLEFVQCTCEHGAHQFLRDADCHDEIRKIKDRLREVLDAANKEVARIQVEEPELAKETGTLLRPRACRPISMRRELSASPKETAAAAAARDEPPKLEPTRQPRSAHSKSSFIEPASTPLEVDTTLTADEIDIEAELPKLQYRSTRAMRNRHYN